MSYLPSSKWGDCTRCDAKNCACVKVGKDLVCIACNNAAKAKKQIDKAKLKNDFRNLKALPENKNAIISKGELDKWFDYVATVIKANPHCWNCGEFIPEQYYRHASAHIFPKAHFESVKTHPLNFLILGAGCGCHHEFDSSIDAACEMKVWPTAVLRFIAFENNITETHKYLGLFKSKLVHRI